MKSARKIASIALVVLSALLVFVGCDQGFDYPSIPTDGQILQKVNLVEGQVIPTDGFDVLITYLDGSSRTISGVSVVETGTDTQKNGVADNGEPIEVAIGKDSNHQDVKATGSISAEPVDHYDVEVAAGATFSAVDKDVADKVSVSAVSASGLSYKLGIGDYIATLATIVNAPITDGTVPAVITVKVGSEPDWSVYSTTLNVVATPESADFVSIESIALNNTDVDIADIDYEELPVPSFDDVTIMVNVIGSENPKQLEAPVDGLRLFYIDNKTNLEINETNIFVPTDGTDTEFRVGVEYNGTVVLAEKGTPVATVQKATLALNSLKSFDKTAYVAGEALPAIDPSDFVATLSYGLTYETISIEDVELGYYTLSGSTWSEITDGKVPTTEFYIRGSYCGAESVKVDSIAITPEPAKTTTYVPFPSSVTLSTVDTYNVPAAQYYDDIDAVINALSSAVIKPFTMTIDGETVNVTSDDIDVVYSTTKATVLGGKLNTVKFLDDSDYDTAYGNKSLVEATNFYIVVTYEVVDKDGNTNIYTGNVTLTPEKDVVSDEISLELSYGETVVYGASVKTADIIFRNDDGITSIVPVNANLNVANLRVLVDGKVINAWPTATLEERDVEVLYQTSTGMMTATGIIPDGIDYISAPAADITVGLTAAAQNKTILIGQAYKDIFTVADFVATGKTVSGAEVELDVTAIEAGSLVATDVSYALPVRIAYVDNEGETKSIQKTVTITATEYVVPENGTFTLKYGEGEYKTGDSIAPSDSETTANAIFAVSGYDKHLDEGTPDTDLVKIMAVTLQRGSSFDYLNNAYQTIPGDVLTFTIAYVNGTTVDKNDDPSTWPTYTMTLNVVDASTLQ